MELVTKEKLVMKFCFERHSVGVWTSTRRINFTVTTWSSFEFDFLASKSTLM
ncbi:hypothetical protein HanRHA438_Chr12g0544971 [Helianthus annuus]|nr:hypothetical protein HanRHA438_Chr12g0544971 [Helianthus annuus]